MKAQQRCSEQAEEEERGEEGGVRRRMKNALKSSPASRAFCGNTNTHTQRAVWRRGQRSAWVGGAEWKVFDKE